MIFYLLLATLFLIFYQDIKSRSIWWFLPPVLFGLFISSNWDGLNFRMITVNILFILGLIAGLIVYLKVRFGKDGKTFFNYFGLGDLLFLLAITPILDFTQFVYFFTIATILSLGIHFLINVFRLQKNVPYAGYLALCTIALLILDKSGVNIFQI